MCRLQGICQGVKAEPLADVKAKRQRSLLPGYNQVVRDQVVLIINTNHDQVVRDQENRRRKAKDRGP